MSFSTKGDTLSPQDSGMSETSQTMCSEGHTSGHTSQGHTSGYFAEADQLFDQIMLESVDVRDGSVKSQIKKFNAFMKNVEEWEAIVNCIETYLNNQGELKGGGLDDMPVEVLYERLNVLKELSANPLLTLSEMLGLINDLRKVNNHLYLPKKN